MNPLTVSDASDARNLPGIRPGAPDAVLASVLDDCDYGSSDREARDILIGCLRDLSGAPIGALPELAFRLMCQRMSARSENHHEEGKIIPEARRIRSTRHVA